MSLRLIQRFKNGCKAPSSGIHPTILCKMSMQSYPPNVASPPESPFILFNEFLTDFKRVKPKELVTMNLSTVNEEYGVSSRTVVYRGMNDNRFVFQTERDSQKSKDIMKDPRVCLMFLFMYRNDETFVNRQVRINGEAKELTKAEVTKLWEQSNLHFKIQYKLFETVERTKLSEFQLKYNEIAKAVEAGEEPLDMSKNFTAFEIVPQFFDFYHGVGNFVFDKIVYNKDNDKWILHHKG